MNIALRVRLRTLNVWVVQRTADGRQIVGIHTHHTQRGVLGSAGAAACGAVVFCCCFDGIECRRLIDHGLQARQGVELCGIGGRQQCRLHGAQVARGHARHAQQFKLGLGGCAIHDRLHRIGQGLHFGHRVHIARRLAVDHVAQQAHFFGRVHPVHANGCVVLLGGVRRRRVVGIAQDGVEAVHNRLHFGCRVCSRTVDGRAGQCVLDGVQIVVVHAHHIGCREVGQAWRCARGRHQPVGVGLRVCADHV